MNAETLGFKDNTFDRVYINKVLLHTDKDKVLQECIRVLKKDGVLIINEMLKHWLFAPIYRSFSPYRKSNPKYMTLQDIKKLKAEHKEFYLFSTFFLFFFYLPLPFCTQFGYTLFNIFARIDTHLLELFPFLRNFTWITVAWLRK
jgi:ubiquinone/menaquinone biosynthesis C-methylase UbiE